jgi:hypothetical protein
VGIGTTNPQARLHSVGNQAILEGSTFDTLVVKRTLSDFGANAGIKLLPTQDEDISSAYIRSAMQTAAEGPYITFGFNPGGERMRIASNGNVGIGTTAPARKCHLHASGSGENAYMKFSVLASGAGLNEGLDIGVDSFGFGTINNRSNFGIAFATNGTNRMILNNIGNVGIGTTAPRVKAHIYGGDEAILRIEPSGIGAREYDVISTSGTTGLGAGNYVIFDRVAVQPRFTISSVGNVGIGTTAPEFTLHVEGSTQDSLKVKSTNSLKRSRVFVQDVSNEFVWFGLWDGNAGRIEASSGKTLLILPTSGGNVGVGTTNPGSNKLYVNGNLFVNGTITPSSDDRVKVEESHISGALPTILKLRPQVYRKLPGLEDTSGGFIESGLIAQEVYYDAPELRHLVKVPEDASGVEVPPAGYGESSDPNADPDYSNWGSTPAALNYIGLIPYLIRGMQEQEARIKYLEAQLATSSVSS